MFFGTKRCQVRQIHGRPDTDGYCEGPCHGDKKGHACHAYFKWATEREDDVDGLYLLCELNFDLFPDLGKGNVKSWGEGGDRRWPKLDRCP